MVPRQQTRTKESYTMLFNTSTTNMFVVSDEGMMEAMCCEVLAVPVSCFKRRMIQFALCCDYYLVVCNLTRTLWMVFVLHVERWFAQLLANTNLSHAIMCMLHSDLHAVLQTLVGLMMQLCKRSGPGDPWPPQNFKSANHQSPPGPPSRPKPYKPHEISNLANGAL